VPVETHIVTVTLTAPDQWPGIIENVRVVIEARELANREGDDVLSGGPDDQPVPTLNVLLDFEPPLLWPSLPQLTIPKGATRALVVRAVTDCADVHWRLDLDWRCGRHAGTFTVPLYTTGDSGFRQA
jgi:hypothetical protein